MNTRAELHPTLIGLVLNAWVAIASLHDWTGAECTECHCITSRLVCFMNARLALNHVMIKLILNAPIDLDLSILDIIYVP